MLQGGISCSYNCIWYSFDTSFIYVPLAVLELMLERLIYGGIGLVYYHRILILAVAQEDVVL